MWSLFEIGVVLFLLTQVALPCIIPSVPYFWLFKKNTWRKNKLEKDLNEIKEEKEISDFSKKVEEAKKTLNSEEK